MRYAVNCMVILIFFHALPEYPLFLSCMLRPFLSYTLTTLILLSQIGLPLHMHYCKGILESVAVFFSAGCDDHKAVFTDLPACCKKSNTTDCTGEADCCNDQIQFVSQDMTAIAPHFDNWDLTLLTDIQVVSFLPFLLKTINPQLEKNVNVKEAGPPRYILHHALIYYA